VRRGIYLVMALCLLICGLVQYWPSRHGKPKRNGREVAAQPQVDTVRRAPVLVAASATESEPNAGSHEPMADEFVIQQIRDTFGTDPQFAETLAREDQQRHPDSPYADERDALLVWALFNQHKFARAQLEAILYFKRYPQGRFAGDIATLMGMGLPQTRRHQ
jgi:hypothetical protein